MYAVFCDTRRDRATAVSLAERAEKEREREAETRRWELIRDRLETSLCLLTASILTHRPTSTPPPPARLAGRSSSDAIDVNAAPSASASATAASARYAGARAGNAGTARGSAAGWAGGSGGGGGVGDGWAKYEAPRGSYRSG